MSYARGSGAGFKTHPDPSKATLAATCPSQLFKTSCKAAVCPASNPHPKRLGSLADDVSPGGEGAEEPKSTGQDKCKTECKSKSEGKENGWKAGIAAVDRALQTPEAREDPLP